ncbi:MAG: tetratricopeptide repeat protein [Planctomycetota bacterium]
MRRLALLLPLVLAACGTTTPTDPLDPTEEQAAPLVRAREAYQRGDLAEAREAVEAYLEEDDDAQARYLYARVLAAQGEFRGAKRELRIALEDQRKDPLLWSLLARVREELGEHKAALRAYQEVQRLVPDSVDPVLGQARCLLVLGEDRAALAVVGSAVPRVAQDPWLAWIRFRAHRRLGETAAAEEAARAFLASPPTGAIDRAAEARHWLSDQGGRLTPEAQQVVVDFVRKACEFRLPDAEAPEDALLAEAPERFFVYDDRPVFVTLYVPAADRGKLGEADTDGTLRGYGRGESLAEALKGAVVELRDSERFSSLAVQNAAVQIDLGLRPLPIQLRERGRELVADPPLAPSQGLATRADGREVYCLPSDRLVAGLGDDASAMLTHACKRAGLGGEAWFAGSRSVFAFETEAFVSTRPGGDPVPLVRSGEPAPLPTADPRSVEAALAAGARWLTTLLTPDGEVRDGAGGTLDLAARARVGLAFARASAALGDDVLEAAAKHVLYSLPQDLPPAARAQLTLAQAALGADVAALTSHLAPLPAGDVPGEREARVRGGAAPPAIEPESPPGVLEAALAAPRPDLTRALEWCEQNAQSPHEEGFRLQELAVWAQVAQHVRGERGGALRDTVRQAAGDVLALQVRDAHRYLLEDPRTVGAFRLRPDSLASSPARTAEAVLTLVEVQRLLVGE